MCASHAVRLCELFCQHMCWSYCQPLLGCSVLSVSVRLSSTVSVSLMWHVGLDPDAVKDGRIKMAGVTRPSWRGRRRRPCRTRAGGARPPSRCPTRTIQSVFSGARRPKFPICPPPQLSSFSLVLSIFLVPYFPFQISFAKMAPSFRFSCFPRDC